jgi:hypothetical protein
LPIKTLETADVFAIYGGPDCPVNEAVGLGMESPVERSTVEQIEDFYFANNHPAVIRVCPLAHESLLDVLKNRDYTLSSFSYRWVLNLANWHSPLNTEDSRVRIADTADELQWMRAVSAGFQDTDAVSADQNLDLERAFFSDGQQHPGLSNREWRGGFSWNACYEQRRGGFVCYKYPSFLPTSWVANRLA